LTYIKIDPGPAPAKWNRSSDVFSPGHTTLLPSETPARLPSDPDEVGSSLWDRYHIGPEGYLVEGPADAPVQSGYPDTGSIATLSSDQFLHFAEIVNAAAKRWPLREVGTGTLKYHQKPDGSTVTYCGTIRPDDDGNVAACKTKPYDHEIKGLPNSCKRRACPECYPDWATKGAQRVSSKLNGRIREIVPTDLKERLCEALELTFPESGADDERAKQEILNVLESGDRYLPRHVVFSPDVEQIARLILRTEKALAKRGIDIRGDTWKYRDEFHRVFHKKYRRKLDQVIRIAGMTGFMEITHDIRLKRDKESHKADRNLDINRYRAILDQSDWRYYVRFSPHSHTAGWGYLMDGDEFHKKTGWIYVNYGTVYSASGLVNYLLSHAPDNPGLHSIRYGGDLNPAYMVVEGEIKIPEFPPCQDCLDEGVPREKAEMVIAKLASVEYIRDKNHRTRIAGWEFTEEGISSRPYRITKIIQVFRRKPPDPRVGIRWLGFLHPHLLSARDYTGWKPDPGIAPWLSEEEQAERKRLEALRKKERERIRKAQQWISRFAWEQLGPEDRARFKWRRYYTADEYAGASAAEKVLTFEWV